MQADKGVLQQAMHIRLCNSQDAGSTKVKCKMSKGLQASQSSIAYHYGVLARVSTSHTLLNAVLPVTDPCNWKRSIQQCVSSENPDQAQAELILCQLNISEPCYAHLALCPYADSLSTISVLEPLKAAPFHPGVHY